MNNLEKKIVKKAEQSSSELKGQIFEVVLGFAITLIGLVVFLILESTVAMPLLVIGVYFLFGGVFGFLSYGIFAFLEKGRYIAFTNEEVIIHSPIAKKCNNITFTSIRSVEQAKAVSFDLFARIWLKRTKTGNVIIIYTNENGKLATISFGGIDNCKDFILALNEAIKSIKN